MGALHDRRAVQDKTRRELAEGGADVVTFPEIDSLDGMSVDQAVEVIGQLGHAYLSCLMSLLWETRGHLPCELEDRIAVRAAYVDAAWRQDLRALRRKTLGL